MSTSRFSALLAFLGACGLVLTVVLGKAAAPVLLDASLLSIAVAAVVYFSTIVLGLWRDSHHA